MDFEIFNLFRSRLREKRRMMLSARLGSSFDDLPFSEQDSAFLARFRDSAEPDATKLRRAEIEERLVWYRVFSTNRKLGMKRKSFEFHRIKLEKEKLIEYKLQIANHRKQLLLIEKEEMRMDNKLEAIIQGIWSRERKLIHNFQALHSCEQRMQQKNDVSDVNLFRLFSK